MKIIITGRGSSGSWQIRGVQLGRSIGADVQPMAMDVAAYDVAIVIKRTPSDLIARIHRAGIPLVYDVVDGYPQPEGNAWNREQCVAWLRAQVVHVHPAAIVAATRAMADDCAEFGLPVLALPHHARPGLRRAPIRPLRTVGYEGAENYITGWRPHIERECKRRGLTFVVNPPSLGDVDIVLALRDSTGYAPRKWKSNVKLANAQALGLPLICAREMGYLETASGGEFWADRPDELAAALDTLEPIATRQRVSDLMFAAAPYIDRIAAEYVSWLRTIAHA